MLGVLLRDAVLWSPFSAPVSDATHVIISVVQATMLAPAFVRNAMTLHNVAFEFVFLKTKAL
jgi:hypothetical protein